MTLTAPSTLPRPPLLVAAACLALAGCSSSSGTEGSPRATQVPRTVQTVEVRETALDTGMRAVGVLEPKDELKLAFKIGGVVARVAVDDGDEVRRGTVLAELDRTEIDAAVERAAQAAQKAARDHDRTQALYADDVATLEQLEDSATALAVARADLDAARFDARHARIESPADGLVSKRLADPSELVAPGQPVLVIGSLDGGWRVHAAVTDRDVVQLSIGDRARVTFDAFHDDVFAAQVERIATASDPANGTYDVELAIDAHGVRFVQGLVAKIELEARSGARTRLAVPVDALLEANGAYATVFVVEGDGAGGRARAARRRIRLGELAGNRAEVREGLIAGERVITDGAAWLTDGEPVTALARAN